MHYLVTGHTGFKGSWLVLMLTQRGHTVSGLALDPAPGGLYETADLAQLVKFDHRVDIRDAAATRDAIENVRPDVVLHLAAQPLVRASYRDPRTTFETNAMGTLNVLEAVTAAGSVKAHVVVTTDKVYRNIDQEQGYVETDSLGGDDPYSASKAMADILTQSWLKSFDAPPTAIARAGNVIGGGDVSEDRLLVDLLRNFGTATPTRLRYPEAVRPWQHVLDCLAGYLTLVDALLEGRGRGEWNFGPGRESFVPVRTVADLAAARWGDGANWETESVEQPHEAGLLALDSTHANETLGWHNRLPFPASLEWTIDWQRAVAAGGDPREVALEQIAAFEALR